MGIFFCDFLWKFVIHCVSIDRSSKPRVIVRQSSQDYDVVDGEADNLVSHEEQVKELQNIRSGAAL